MSRLVRPQPLRGFRYLLPEEMLLRNEVVDRIRKVYESFGFVPIDTPVLEAMTTLVGSGGSASAGAGRRRPRPSLRKSFG